MTNGKSMRSALGRDRGLGSAKEGVHHWWLQRLTAVALVPLLIWFVAGIAAHAGASHAEVAAWLGPPLVAAAMVLLIVAGFWHAALGVQVVIEDYVAHEGWRMTWLVAAKFAFVVLAVIALISVLKLAAI